MRKVVVYELVSLDGIAERPIDFMRDFDEVMCENLKRVIGEQDCVLLGRRTFDEWAEFWPTSDNEPFASFINNVQKYVFTSTSVAPSWNHTTITDRELDELVGELKEQPGGDIGVHGSITLAQSLLERDLVDELRLVIAPTLAVNGRKLFEGSTTRHLELTRSVASPTGSLLVDFRLQH